MEQLRLKTLPGLELPVLPGQAHPCPYLPEQRARSIYAFGPIDSTVYQELMDRGFRRSGEVFYRPTCPACTACRSMRVDVDAFAPSRSQRRVLRRNVDIEIEVGSPAYDAERFELFAWYQKEWHDGAMLGDAEDFARFLVDSPLHTVEMTYRAAGRLLGVGILDVTPAGLSSVYFYFAPAAARRSLGVFSALCEIQLARKWGRRYWYPGFFVAGCRKMEYKRGYQPAELLHPDGVWRPFA